MKHIQPHQPSQQVGTSITKAVQHYGCAPMRQCSSKWLKPTTGQGCLR